MTNLLTSWCSFWRQNKLFWCQDLFLANFIDAMYFSHNEVFFTSWWTFWHNVYYIRTYFWHDDFLRHHELFDDMTCFWHNDKLFDIMTYFWHHDKLFTAWWTFWCHDMFLALWQTFLMSWQTLLTSWCTLPRQDIFLTSWWNFLMTFFHIMTYFVCTAWWTFWCHDVILT